MLHGTLRSRYVGEPVDWAVGLPPGHHGEAAALCLPGRGSDARWVMDTLHVVDFVAAAGLRYAVAAVDGGETYWHRRAGGEDRMRMLLEEFTPLIQARFGPRALLGWSMGGYGALLAAERHAARFPTVAVSSAAIWPAYAEQHAAVPDAFDGPADFARNDVFAGAGRLAGSAVSISCGTADAFLASDRAFAAGCTRTRRASSSPAATTRASDGGCCRRRCATSAATSREYRLSVILPKERDPRFITTSCTCSRWPSRRTSGRATRSSTSGHGRAGRSGCRTPGRRAAGQAAAVAHVAAHELGATAYAIKAARAKAPGCEERAGRLECRWQREQLPDAIRELVLDDQRRRNDICWSVFDC